MLLILHVALCPEHVNHVNGCPANQFDEKEKI